MVREGTVGVDSRTVGFADFGPPDGEPVIWCHGGPGSRLEPTQTEAAAASAGLRLIGIDRPGYGLSTPQPGRSIAGWATDAIAVADELGLGEFAAVGVSTGGAYALALAALREQRVTGVVVCCGLTDMAWSGARDGMPRLGTMAVWEAESREEALAASAELWGEDGSSMPAPERPLAPADMALFSDATWLQGAMATAAARWTFGVQGYTDDRIADGGGWRSFEVGRIRCPVLVVHGGADSMVPVAHARHTAAIVPGARLQVYEDDGHISVIRHVVPALTELISSRDADADASS